MILLAEAVKLKSILQKKYNDLVIERRRLAFISVEKGTVAKRDGRTFEIAQNELHVIMKDIRTLDRLVYEANSLNTVTFQEEQLPIVEAIEYAKQLRLEAAELKELSEHEREVVEYGYGESVQMVQVALFDPDELREQALTLEKMAHRLSNSINAKNYEIKIDFDDSNYM
jgi:hypothetical protein